MNLVSGPAADCERLRDGFLAQPVNSISSLAMVAAGVLVIAWARRRSSPGAVGYFGGLLIVTGIGSAAFHGYPGPATTWLHDASLIGLVSVAAMLEFNRRVRPRWAGTWWWIYFPAAAGAVALLPESTTALSIIPAVLAFGLAAAPPNWSKPESMAAAEPDRRKDLMAPLAVLGIGFGVYLLSRTDGPLCAPESLLQGHAIWHLSVAVGVGLYTLTALSRGSYSGVT